MKHTLDELLDIVYRYYPRGVGPNDPSNAHRNKEAEEQARLVAARQKAATDERWHSLLRRVQERFPEAPLMNHSLHLPTGKYDACYSFTISPPKSPERLRLWFQVSFLAPYYIVFSSGLTEREIVIPPREFLIEFQGMPIYLPGGAARAGLLSNPDDERLKGVTLERREFVLTFDPSPEEQPYAAWIAREIEATFGCEPMPPEVGTALVPDVATQSRRRGEVRVYDCLFSDTHPWVLRRPYEERAPAMELDANRLTEKGIAVVTVLAALIRLVRTALQIEKWSGAVHLEVETDEGLGKDELLAALAWIRQLDEPPQTPRDLAARSEVEAATRELEALITAWDGEGAPSDAMVAWASRFLASRDVGAS
jgi:hypothetical protein